MRLHYSGPEGNYPVYICDLAHQQYGEPLSQSVRTLNLDTEVERLLLAALAPDQIALALVALQELEQEKETLQRQQALCLERLHYEAERARRQFDAVEPDNRLVARTLEKRWEEALRTVEKAEHAHAAWLREQPLALTDVDKEYLLALGQDLPRVWETASTTAEDRKHILRCVIKEVVADRTRIPGYIWFQINWQTGLVTYHQYERSVNRYPEHPHWQQLEQRLWALHKARKYDCAMAEIRNAERFRTARNRLFTSDTVSLLRIRLGVPPLPPTPILPLRWEDGTYSVEGVAREVGVLRSAVYRWFYDGHLTGKRNGKRGEWMIPLDAEQITKLREHALRRKCRLVVTA